MNKFPFFSVCECVNIVNWEEKLPLAVKVSRRPSRPDLSALFHCRLDGEVLQGIHGLWELSGERGAVREGGESLDTAAQRDLQGNLSAAFGGERCDNGAELANASGGKGLRSAGIAEAEREVARSPEVVRGDRIGAQ